MIRALSWACRSALAVLIMAPAVLGQTVVGPGEVLPVTVSTAEDFTLEGGTLAPTNVTLSGTMDLNSSSRIVRPQNRFVADSRGLPVEGLTGPTHLNGSIIGTGDLELGNGSRDQLFVNGHNSYTGQTYITAGEIIATTSTAFGSPAGITTIQGADVRLDAATDEPFRIEGGTLRISAGDFVPSTPIILAGGTVHLPSLNLYQLPIVVDNPGGSLQFHYNATGSWTGGSTGTGSLRLVGRVGVDAPLAHDGDLIIDGVRLNVPNSYTGKTVFTGNYVIDRGDVFGTATSPIEINEGHVTVQVLPMGNRGFVLTRGTLDIQTTEPINASLTLGGGFEAVLRGIGTFNAPINYVTVQGGGNASIQGGTFNAPIRGDTDLRLGGNEGVTLNAANDIHGLVHVTVGTVAVNHAQALPLPATLIQGGVVELNTAAIGLPIMSRYPYASQQVGTVRLNVDQHISGSSYLGEGTLESRADVRFDRLLTRSSKVTTAGQGSVTVDGELVALGSSSLSGTIKGNGAIRLVGTSLMIDGDLSEFEGDLIVENGIMYVGASIPLGKGDIHVGEQGRLVFVGDSDLDNIVDNDIYLHNVNPRGNGVQSAVSFSVNSFDPLHLRGRLDVGAQGSTISTSRAIAIQGNISGNNLNLSGGAMVIESPQTQLGGVLTIRNKSRLSLSANGALHNLDLIHLAGGGGLNITSETGPIDRIDDSTAIRSDGGTIELYHHQHLTGSETLGTLHLNRGFTEILARADSPLLIQHIERERGSLLRFSEHAGPGGVGFINSPPLPYGMLGGWAVTESGFATLDASNRFATLQPTASNLNTAGPTDHVAALGQQSLTADRVVASLNNRPTGNPYSLDLNGHQLTVRSGGIYSSGDIVNGALTAGDGQPAELTIYQTNRIDANIVDNGPDGSVALVTSREHGLRLAGVNTYTGGTWVIGNQSDSKPAQLILERLESIPINDRVYLDYGRYHVHIEEPSLVKLSELHVRGDSYFTGGNATFDTDVYYLEHGALSARLVGDGTIFKDSDRSFDFGNDSSPDFTGPVYVRDGVLRLGRTSIPNAPLFVEGGTLEVSGQSLRNHIVLDGGTLQGNFDSVIELVSDSTLFQSGVNTLLYGQLSGDADLTVLGDRTDRYVGIFGDASQFTGDLHVRNGVLRIGTLAELGAGEIYLDQGAQLLLSSTNAGQAVVERDIHIRHGSLHVAPPGGIFEPNSPNGLVLGDVYVQEMAFFGANGHGKIDNQRIPALVLGGRVVLDDGAHVIGRTTDNAIYFAYDVPLIEVTGRLDVGRNNVWRLELAALAVTGSIQARFDDSSIDFQGLGSMLQIDQATIVVEAGRTLSVTVNGAPLDMHLATSGAGLSGGGTVAGNFSLVDGATVAPGSSAGGLTIAGDLKLGPGAVYEWEIENFAAAPGVGWDLLNVQGTLAFHATPDSPWILELNDLQDVLALEASEWLIASATTIEGFDSTSVQVALGNVSNNFEATSAGLFAVELRGGDLYLILTVPEPASVPCIALLCLMLLACIRARH